MPSRQALGPCARWPLPVRMALGVGVGAVMATGLAPVGWWPATLIGFFVLPALFLAGTTARQAGWTGWAIGAGYFAHALLWIVEPFLVDVARHGWMAPFALVGLAGGLALFWAAAGWSAARLGRGATGTVLALVLCLGLAEYARAYVLTGFPWGAIAQIWVVGDAPGGTAQLLAWIGPQGLALWTMAAGLLPGLYLVAGPGGRAGPVRLIPALTLIAASGVAGLDRAGAGFTDKTVRLIQPNARQDQKWDPAYIPIFFERQVGYTAATPRPDLIVWPEAALPTLLDNAGPALDVIADAAGGTSVALGVQRRDGLRIFNSLAYLGRNGQVAGLYDKHHLVPFGEYIPLGAVASRFGLRGFAAQEGDGYSPGPGPQVLDFGAVGRGTPLICYEAVFPQYARHGELRPDFLIQVTNDAWFGERSGPYQHLAQARMRAIEQGLPMIRAANTGISAMIDARGRITAHLPLGQAGYIDAPLPRPLPSTLYARTGDLPVLLLLLAGLAVLVARGRSDLDVDPTPRGA